MLAIEKNKILAPLTTIKIGAAAEFFAVISGREDLQEAIAWSNNNRRAIFILGGGSNVLITKKISGLVLKNEIKGIEIIKKNKESVLVEAKSGEAWTRLVKFTVDNNLYGLENLFLIYGTVGAAPVQNIGAYGVELKDVFHSLKAIDLKTGKERIFTLPDCRFGYRDSIFKNLLQGRYFIYSVVLKLSTVPNFKLDYGSIRQELLQQGIEKPNQSDIIRIIQKIRNNKLPNPGLLANAGSFFKNTEISAARFKELTKKYPAMPGFPVGRLKVKIPSGWLIESAGFKGKRIGSVSMYEKQALILVNHGQASAKDALNLIKKVKIGVKKKFGIDLEEEVNVI